MRLACSWLALSLALAAVSGCARRANHATLPPGTPLPHLESIQVEYPDVEAPSRDDIFTLETPPTLRDMSQVEYWDLSLEEAVRIGLATSRVLRDLGGTVVRAPDTTPTSLETAIQETDPRFGVAGALSAFDAQFNSRLFGERVDRRLNNRFLGQLGSLQGYNNNWDTQFTKRSATGTQLNLRQHIDFLKDNNPGNEFPDGAWTVWYEGEARHPLLQGSGLQFNRIAGPGATPGNFNGVLIARIRTDITLAEFEIALRDFTSNVENAYWDLYYAYRDLAAKVRARDTALETWRRIHALYEAGRRGGEAEKEAQAREQYYRFESEVQDSLAGRPLDGTRTNNGSLGGTFRGLPGVLVCERRLRLLLNLPPNTNQLIRPADEPSPASITFEWPSIASEAIVRRSELRRQRWQVKRREMELLASRNFLLPSLDIVGLYRFRGFGDDLINPVRAGQPEFDNAYKNLTGGDFQEWQAGLELSMPIGFRQAHAGVRNAELRLAREKVLLEAQEREIIYDLTQAVAEMDRAYVVMQTNYNRWVAARQQAAAVESAFEDDRVEFIAVLDAQRRQAEDEAQFYRSRAEYAVGVKNVHFEKGTLLDYLGIAFAESAWPEKAYVDAARQHATRGHAWAIPPRAPLVSTGPAPAPIRLPAIEEELPLAAPQDAVPEAPAQPMPVP
ncbi:MAG: TolC family protein [Pirellulaceae bacterium]|nr:TolC family protein [Pirellulaceae bacterium]